MGAKQILVYCVPIERQTINYRFPGGLSGSVTFSKRNASQEFPMAEVDETIAMQLKGMYSYDIKDANRRQVIEFLSENGMEPTHCPTCGKPSGERVAAVMFAPEQVKTAHPISAPMAPSNPVQYDYDEMLAQVESITLEQLEVINKEHGFAIPFDATLSWHQRTHYGYLKGERPHVPPVEMPDAIQVGELGDTSTHTDFVIAGEQRCVQYLAELGYTPSAEERSSLVGLATVCLRERTALQWAHSGVGPSEGTITHEENSEALPADPSESAMPVAPIVRRSKR